MSDPNPDLNTVQRWFQAVISHPDGVAGGIDAEAAQALMKLRRSELERLIRRSKNLSAEERLGIYANAYYARLLECLRESFPVLCKALGRELFDEFAFDYLQRFPSTSYTLSRLGDRFADFLEETRPDKGEGTVGWPDFLIDVARLEWLIEQVFDGPGVEGQGLLTAEMLGRMDAATFGGARIVPVVCLRLLAFKYPVNAYYTAARRTKEGEEAPEMPEAGAQYLALTRREFVVRRIELSAGQHALLETLMAGRTVNEAIAAAAERWTGDEAGFAAAVREWFRDGAAAGFFWRIEA
ncbi:MAG: hypothetical protein JWN40_3506 [Phycisphaerales bacterium]|nr:hypothetical protein [Phycisphaerales bacterium]